MKLFTISALAIALTTTSVSAQNVSSILKDTTVSMTAVVGSFDFNIEGNRRGTTELELGFTALEHSYDGVDAAFRFALGKDLSGSSNFYGRVEYNFESEVANNFDVYGSVAVQYTTNTNLNNGTWSFDPSLGAVFGLTDRISLFTEVGYTWELNRTKRDLGGYVEVGLPVAVTENFSVTPSVSRTFRTDANTTSAHLNFTYRF